MGARPRHPRKVVEAAICYAEDAGWELIKRQGHCWGRLRCPHHDRTGCQVSVWSTPRDDDAHARAIVRAVDRCSHDGSEDRQ